MKIIHMIPQAVMNHPVNKLAVIHPVTSPRLFEHIRAKVHVLLATCHDHISIFTLNSLSREHHGLQARSTNLVYSDSAHLPGKTGPNHSIMA